MRRGWPAALLAAMLIAAIVACGDDDDDGGGVAVCPVTNSAGAPTAAPANPPQVNGDIVTTPSGLTYVEVCLGSGDTPASTSDVSVYYTGYLQSNGRKFDSSVDRGAPTTFAMDGVIAGFSEGLSTMREGGVRRLIIPAALGYAERGSGDLIPPNAVLIFDVELVDVVN